MKVKISMIAEVDDSFKKEISRIENHIEEFIDLEAYPEIQSIYDVIVEYVL